MKRFAILRQNNGNTSIIRLVGEPGKSDTWDIYIPDAGQGNIPTRIVDLLNDDDLESLARQAIAEIQ